MPEVEDPGYQSRGLRCPGEATPRDEEIKAKAGRALGGGGAPYQNVENLRANISNENVYGT